MRFCPPYDGALQRGVAYHGAAARRIRLPDLRASPARHRSAQRAHRAQARAPCDRRLSHRRDHHRPLRARCLPDAGEHHPGLRARRGDAPLRDRARARARRAHIHAARDLRARRRAAGAHRRGARAPCPCARAPALARRHRGGARACHVGNCHRARDPGGSRRAPARIRAARLRHPPVSGHGRGAAARPPSPARAGRRKRRRQCACELRRCGARGRDHRSRDRRDRARRPLSAQPVLSSPRPERVARGDDRGRAPRRARRGADHAACRHVDGARRLPRRRAAGGIELPPRDRGRHRAVPRPPAGALLHGRRHEHRCGAGARQSRPGAGRRGPHHRAQGRDRMAALPADMRATRFAARRLCAHRRRRVFLRAHSARRHARHARCAARRGSSSPLPR